MELYQDKHFLIKQSDECLLPGYLIIIAKDKAPAITDLPTSAQQALGPILVKTTHAIQKVINPACVYCASFGELFHQIHFHLFPRTDWLLKQYLAQHPQHKDYISGPLIMDWAKLTFTKPLASYPLQPALSQIQRLLSAAQTS